MKAKRFVSFLLAAALAVGMALPARGEAVAAAPASAAAAEPADPAAAPQPDPAEGNAADSAPAEGGADEAVPDGEAGAEGGAEAAPAGESPEAPGGGTPADGAAETAPAGSEAGAEGGAGEEADGSQESAPGGQDGVTLAPAAPPAEGEAAGPAVTGQAGQAAAQTDSEQIEAFVRRLYQICMGREADGEGLATWIAALLQGGYTGADTAYGFFVSKEYKAMAVSDEQYITDLYRAMFGREPDDAGRATWQACLDQGLSRDYLFQGFVNGTEFQNLCRSYGIRPGSFASSQPRDQNPNVTAFVNRLYQVVMGRKGDENGLNDWTGLLNAGTASAAQVAHGFFFGKEYKDKHTGERQFLADLYRAMFDREGDAAGIQTWLDTFATGASRLAVLDGFAGSTEFQNLCARYGVTPGRIADRELRDLHPGPATFVYRLLKNLLGAEPGDEVNTDVQRLVNGEGGDSLALEVLASASFAAMGYENYEMAGVLYPALLNRTPTQQETGQVLLALVEGQSVADVARTLMATTEFAAYCKGLGVAVKESPDTPDDGPIYGIDVSQYQNVAQMNQTGHTLLDWNAVKASGVEFVMVRAISTNNADQIYVDEYFYQNVRGAKAAGLKVGAYLFSYATNEQEVINEVTAFLNAVAVLEAEGIRFDYPLAVDMEKNLHNLSRERLSQLTQMALALLDQNGYYPMLYTGDYFYRDNLIGSYFDGYDKWIAHYGAPVVSLPAGEYQIWQFSSTGQVPGIAGNVDQNWCYVDYAAKIPHTTNSRGEIYNNW